MSEVDENKIEELKEKVFYTTKKEFESCISREGITKRDFAQSISISPSLLTMIFSGVRNMTDSVMEKILKRCGVSESSIQELLEIKNITINKVHSIDRDAELLKPHISYILATNSDLYNLLLTIGETELVTTDWIKKEYGKEGLLLLDVLMGLNLVFAENDYLVAGVKNFSLSSYGICLKTNNITQRILEAKKNNQVVGFVYNETLTIKPETGSKKLMEHINNFKAQVKKTAIEEFQPLKDGGIRYELSFGTINTNKESVIKKKNRG